MYFNKTLMAAAMTAALALPGAASAVAVDVELDLLVDESSSVDAAEFDLQREGYAQAFESVAIQNLIAGLPGGIAVRLVYWSSSAVTGVGWTQITSAAEADAFAAAIRAAARPGGNGTTTGIANALDFSIATDGITDNDFEGNRLVIDVSGDGEDNVAVGGDATVQASRDAALAAGVDRINGLAILNDVADLNDYYAANVQGGAGSFVVSVANFADFATAVQSKIFREIQGAPEPAVLGMMGLGLFGLGLARRRQRR